MATQDPPTYTEKVGQEEDLWYGHYPCLCSQSKGCDKHNPSQTQVYHNQRLVAATKPKPALPIRLHQRLRPSKYHTKGSTSTKDGSKSDHEFFMPMNTFSTELPLDVYSAEAIPPLHPSIPYYLSFYHLSCAHRSLQSTNRDALVEQLSCSGASSPSDPGPRYQWRSEVFYKDKKFFQFQDIFFDITRENASTKLVFCRHESRKIGPVEFYKHGGFEHAKCNDIPLLMPGQQMLLQGTPWKSSWGNYHGRGGCGHCLTDYVVSLRLLGNVVRLQIELYRALGPGEGRPTSPEDSVWAVLLTGKGSPRRTLYKSIGDVRNAVWDVGQKLGQLYPDKYSTAPKGRYVA